MPRSRRIPVTVLALPLLAAVLAGCTAAPEPIVLEPGACVAEAQNNRPARDTVVDCTEPHRFDIVATLGAWPDATAAIEAGDARTVYERLVRADPADELARSFQDWAAPRCEQAFDDLVGASAIALEEAPDGLGLEASVELWPIAALDGLSRFAAGDHTVVCAVGWPDAAGELRRVSYPAAVTIADLLTGSFPLDERECFDFGEGDVRSPVACAEPHSGQALVTLDAARALGAEWVADVDPETGRAGGYAAADELCELVLAQLLPEDSLGDGLKVWADIDPTGGWVGFDGTVVDGAEYPVSCSVIAPRDERLEGDAFAGTAVVVEG